MSDRHVIRQWQTALSQLARVTPRQALQSQQCGAWLVDIRPEYQRRADGDIPGAIVIERNHLEWRLDPCSPSRIAEATAHDLRWIVVCDEGYSSALAAVSLQAIGLVNATDVEDGFQRWRADGCPVTLDDPPAVARLAPHDTRVSQLRQTRRAPEKPPTWL
jgi:rhodanese-related sulfurtransferase